MPGLRLPVVVATWAPHRDGPGRWPRGLVGRLACQALAGAKEEKGTDLVLVFCKNRGQSIISKLEVMVQTSGVPSSNNAMTPLGNPALNQTKLAGSPGMP
jgi:hypothetical protein